MPSLLITVSINLLAFNLLVYSSCADAQDNNASMNEPLPEVEVIESVTDRESRDSFAGIKSMTDRGELPLTIENLSEKVLENVRSQNLESLLDAYSTATTSPDEGGLVSAIILRGFTDSSFYRNGLNDSLGTIPLRDVANTQSVEILKGASSALYGTGEPGGSVNIITKRPQFDAAHSIRLNLGQFDKYRTEIDSTGALPGTEKFAYRMIAAYENGNSFRDTIESSRIFAAPSLSWIPNQQWNIFAELEYIQHKTPYDTGLVAVDENLVLPRDRYLGEVALDKTRLQAITGSLSAQYESKNSWALSTKLLWQNTDIDGFKAEPDELDISDTGQTLLSREVQREIDDADGFSVQIELSKTIFAALAEHKLLAGYEFISAGNYVELDVSDTDADSFEIDIFNPLYMQTPPALFPVRRTDETIDQHSFYVQDFIAIAENLKILIGSRFDKIDIVNKERGSGTSTKQNDDEISSRIAALYDLNPYLGLFVSYGESSETNEGLTPQGESLKPSRGKSIEGGIKLKHPYADFILDLSLYDIEQTNIAVDAPGAPGFEIQTARQKSRGVDLEMSAKPANWFYANVRYAYTSAEILDDPEIPDGTRPINVPRHKLVLSSFFSCSVVEDKDFQAGLSFRYRSSQKASIDPDELDVRLPSYWLADVFINYRLTPRINLGININNFLDAGYIASTQVDTLHLHPGSPRTISGSIKISF